MASSAITVALFEYLMTTIQTQDFPAPYEPFLGETLLLSPRREVVN
jgi:hypothetical protein